MVEIIRKGIESKPDTTVQSWYEPVLHILDTECNIHLSEENTVDPEEKKKGRGEEGQKVCLQVQNSFHMQNV